MASVLISSLLKATTDWLSLIRSTPTTSSSTTTVTAVVDDLEKLERLLPRIKATLLDAEKREVLDESLKLWLKEIKDVAYDADDVLDEYKYHVLRAQVENRDITTPEASRKRKRVEGQEEVMASASSNSNIVMSEISILNSMDNKIKSIRKRFKEISKDRDLLQLKQEDGERRRDGSSEYPQPTSHMIVKQEICGRDDDKGKLVDWLFSNRESRFEVLAVVGKGGLGKTTLAQLLYNDQKVSDYFNTRMWICVSDDFNLIRLTRAMIESINGDSCAMSELSALQTSVKKKLEGKRVLLVLDDVWNDKKGLWESLIMPLRENGAEMVRIIVTTRNEPVSKVMQTRENPYRLGYLTEDQCWELFKRHAFCGRDPAKFPSLVEIGKKIVKKCDGLPLAVKSLGGLLQHEMDKDEWEKVIQSQLWELDTEILPALKLSYIRMPSHLKPCFEICSMFPKDYRFKKDELVKLWAAHGYIQHNAEKDAVEKKGYKYFNELHRRSFFDKFMEDYKMHDNIHDLAHYVHVGMVLSNHIKHKIRHLSTENKSLEFNLDDVGALRTLIVREENKEAIYDITRLCRNMTMLTHLRYLCIKFYWYRDEFLLFDRLSNLISLRHLELIDSTVDIKLPKSIGDLYKLVVLKITCDRLVAVPETLRNLLSLTTIHFQGFKNDLLPALGQLPSLRSLIIDRFERVKNIGNEFCRGQNNRHGVAFPSLTSLVFKNMYKWEKWDELQEGDFPQLQKLVINYCTRLSSLPSLGNLSMLSHISLIRCELLQLPSLPPNVKTLENICNGKLSLPQGLVGLMKLERLSGIFRVKVDEVFEILKKSVSVKRLSLSNIILMNGEARLREYNGIEDLALNFYYTHEDNIYFARDKNLHLIVEKDENDAFFSLQDKCKSLYN